jgi:PAS domain S-box-containing protein
LLVDDNTDMRNYVKRLLLSQGYEVETAADGMAALAIIQQHIPDLVLTDVMMPRLDGFGLLRELRTTATTREIPIIMLSARAGEEARIEGLEAGADDYLTKPFSAREVLARVEANLQLAQLRREAMQQEQVLRLEAESAKQTVENILSSISDGFYTLDRNWCYTYVNDRYCEMARMERKALLGKSIWDLFSDVVDTNIYVQFHRAMSEQTPLQFEYLYSNWNCWFEYRAYPSADALTIFVADISDRKQTEAEIQQLNQQLTHRLNELQTLFDLLPVGVAISQDPECRIIRVNSYLSELIRLPVDANASQCAPPEERPVYRIYRDDQEIATADLPMQYAAFHNTVVRDEVVDIVHPDGTVIKLLCYASPLLDEQGKVRGVIGGFADITQRIQKETALREQRTLLETILRQAADGIIVCDATGKLTFVNKEARRLTQQDPDGTTLDLNLLDWGTAYDTDGNLIPLESYAISKALRGEVSNGFEARMVRRDGSYYDILVSAAPLWNEKQEIIGAVNTFIDISDRKRAEAERERLLQQAQVAQKEAETANRIKDEFLTVLSHELRSPLNPILGWATLLQTRQFDAQGTKRALQTIERNAKLQVQLIEDLLDVSRILRGKMVLNVCPVNLVAVVESALETVHLAADGMPEIDGYMLMRQIRTRSPEQGGLVNAIALTAYAGEYNQQKALKVGFQQHIPKPAEPDALVNAIATLVNQK